MAPAEDGRMTTQMVGKPDETHCWLSTQQPPSLLPEVWIFPEIFLVQDIIQDFFKLSTEGLLPIHTNRNLPFGVQQRGDFGENNSIVKQLDREVGLVWISSGDMVLARETQPFVKQRRVPYPGHFYTNKDSTASQFDWYK